LVRRLNWAIPLASSWDQDDWTIGVCSVCAPLRVRPEHRVFGSDLAGLDPIHHGDNDRVLVGWTYEWLRDVVKRPVMNRQATTVVQDKYHEFCQQLQELNGSGGDGCPQHDEVQELMYEICDACGCGGTGGAARQDVLSFRQYLFHDGGTQRWYCGFTGRWAGGACRCRKCRSGASPISSLHFHSVKGRF